MEIDVVIVTYNRLSKLKRTLSCYENQTVPFRNIIIVNNNSSDGTAEYLRAWEKTETPFKKIIINTHENLGGAGGFYLGEKKAMSLNPDWIFIADDDAYPEPDLMEKFLLFAEKHPIDKYSAICASVLTPDGNIDVSHRSHYTVTPTNHFIWDSSSLEEYQKPFFTIDFLSYVGPFINVQALKKVGLINPKFFIYNDDSEHSLRLKHYGDIICVPDIRITHDIKKVGQVKEQVTDNTISATWGDYYSNRNEMVMMKKHFPKVAKKRFMAALKHHLKGKDKTPYEKLVWIAIRDAWLHRMGKHTIYKPGWSVKNN